MRLTFWALFFAIFFAAASVHADCVDDHRSNKKAGILVTDFTITGTQSIGAAELARITSDLIGSCFDEEPEEMKERIRASFQDRGYFAVNVKSLKFKPNDVLGVPKPVTLEAEVSDGLQYKLAEITFVENHAFSADELRQQFPLKRGDLFARAKVASGLMALRKLYSTQGFLDWTAIPGTNLGSNGTANLTIAIHEGPQCHMGKLEIVADADGSARLRAEWKLAEGEVYDQTYIDQYLDANRRLLPSGFSRANVSIIKNCPDALVEVRLLTDTGGQTSRAEPKNVPCKEQHDDAHSGSIQ